MILYDFWYVGAVASEVGRTPLARVICGMPIVFYRTEAGDPVALRDLCSHRRAPLSMGRAVGDTIECPYHGLLFDPNGRCVHIPSQDVIPAQAHIRAYPVQERQGLIWVWPGEPAMADPETIPDLPWRESPEWNSETIYYYHVHASHILMTDNLLDLGHVAFIHSGTIGFDASRLKDDPLVTQVSGDQVVNTRVMSDVKPSANVQRWGNFPGLIERSSVSTWSPPCNTSIQFRNRDQATNVELRIDHLITPESDDTHHYWVSVCRNFRIDDAALTRQVHVDNDAVHQEDLAIVEAQQRMISVSGKYADMPIKQDRGLIAAHRIMDRLAAAEAARRAPATLSAVPAARVPA